MRHGVLYGHDPSLDDHFCVQATRHVQGGECVGVGVGVRVGKVWEGRGEVRMRRNAVLEISVCVCVCDEV